MYPQLVILINNAHTWRIKYHRITFYIQRRGREINVTYTMLHH